MSNTAQDALVVLRHTFIALKADASAVLARRYNGMVATTIADILFVPAAKLPSDANLPIESLAMPLLLGLLGIGLVFALSRIGRAP